jgi:hypothetical protein
MVGGRVDVLFFAAWAARREQCVNDIFEIVKIEQDRGSYSVDVQIRSRHMNLIRLIVTTEAKGFGEVEEIVREKLFELGKELQAACRNK